MATKLPLNGSFIALDVGDKRIGVAVASAIAKLPSPLATIDNDEKAFQALNQIIERESAKKVVVGLPRNLDGQETAQTRKIRDFAKQFTPICPVPIAFADETLSSVRAQNSRPADSKNSVDALAACFILEEYFHSGEAI